MPTRGAAIATTTKVTTPTTASSCVARASDGRAAPAPTANHRGSTAVTTRAAKAALAQS